MSLFIFNNKWDKVINLSHLSQALNKIIYLDLISSAATFLNYTLIKEIVFI